MTIRTFLHMLSWALLPLMAFADLDRQWRAIETSSNLQVRSLFGFVLDAVAEEAQPERVEKALQLAEQMQDRDPASVTFGNFRWYWNEPGVTDRNAVEFAMERGALVWKLYRDRLTPEGRASLARMITLAEEGLKRHRPNVGYTNIFLMKTWNCIALGENSDRPALARLGYDMMDTWLLYTWRYGFREYLSPTYTAVDLGCLGLMANHAENRDVRRKALVALPSRVRPLAASHTPISSIFTISATDP